MAEPHWSARRAADPRSTRTPSLGSTPARGKSAYPTTSTPNSTKSPPHRTVDLAKSCVQPSLNTSGTLRPGSGTQSPGGVDSRPCVGRARSCHKGVLLRDDLDDDTVADLVWSTNAVEYYLLRGRRGWTAEDYGRLLTELWSRTLLAR